NRLSRIFLLDLQKCRIDILGSVAERIEGGHQDDDIEKEAPPFFNRFEDSARLTAALFPGWRFLDIAADVEHKQRRECADHKHSTPTEEMVGGAVKDGS